ncbi:MAG: hypothetical protein Q9208_005547 [Pyrenodesmia sp. 3 TL-2023]
MDASTHSISLLERTGLNNLLPPYENAERIQCLIAVLQTRTSELPAFLRRFYRWVDSTTRDPDTSQTSNQDFRLMFQASSEAITEYIELLARLAHDIYCAMVTLQRDLSTDRELLAWMHDDLDRAKFDVVAMAEIWLNLRRLPRYSYSSIRDTDRRRPERASRYKLFGNPAEDEASEDPEQPPPSPASDGSYEILVDQEVALHSTMARGVIRRRPQLRDQAPVMPVSPTTKTPLAPVLLLLLIFHFFGIL